MSPIILINAKQKHFTRKGLFAGNKLDNGNVQLKLIVNNIKKKQQYIFFYSKIMANGKLYLNW